MSRSGEGPGAWPRRAAAAALLLVCLLLHFGLWPYAFDDAYIHLRIAEHWISGGAPYFNAGQPLMASSSPGWTWVLAPLVALPGSPVLAVALFNALACWAGALVYGRLAGALVGRALPPVLFWSLAVAYVGIVHYAGTGLMEIPLALLLLGSGLRLYVARRPTAFLLLAAASFVRLELTVFFLVLLVHAALRRRLPVWRALGWSLPVALPMGLYEWLYFHTLVPHTAVAKSAVYQLTVGQALHLTIDTAMPDIPGLSFVWSRAVWIGLLVVVAGGAVFGAVSDRAAVRERELVGLLLGTTLVIPAVYVSTASLVFPWYVPLFLAPLTLLLALPLTGLRRPLWRGVLLAALLLPHGLGLADSLVAAVGDPAGYRHFADNARVRKYLEIGARLQQRYPGARLLSSEVGGLGYTFAGEILDGVGLVSDGALKYHPMRVPEERSFGFIGAIPVDYIRETRPELIVSMDIFIEAFLRSDLAREYTLIREPIYVEDDLRRVRHPVLWNSRHMNIFIRKPTTK